MTALQGLRVLDLSRILAGPWCTQTLADLGAQVIKVEKPGRGDDTRAWGPPFAQSPSGGASQASAYFLSANRNKHSITCDISKSEGQALIRELVQKSDVFVENFKVGDLARYGLDYAALQALNPKLVYCSITGFGQTGPCKDKAGYDFMMQGLGGLMSITGAPGGEPQKVGVAVADLFCGMYATTAILAALRHAEQTGQGQHIDMALFDAQLAMLANVGANYLVSGQVPQQVGNAHANIVPYQTFEVAGGEHIIVAVGNDQQYYKFCSAIGMPELGCSQLYAKNEDRVRNREPLVAALQTIMKTRTQQDCIAAFEAAGIPCGPINNVAQALANPQVQARGMVSQWDDGLQLVASPMKLSATPVGPGIAPPHLGQHTQEILRDVLGYSVAQLAQLTTDKVI